MATPEEVQAYFENLPRKIRKDIAAAVRAQGERLADAQRAAARPHSESGTLVESIRVEDGRDDLEVIVKAGGDLTTKEIRGGSGVDYDYALAVEFGTTRMAAEPFFYPPYRELRRSMAAEIEDAVNDALSKV